MADPTKAEIMLDQVTKINALIRRFQFRWLICTLIRTVITDFESLFSKEKQFKGLKKMGVLKSY